MTASQQSKGTIRIVDTQDVYVAETDHLDGDVTVDISSGTASIGTTVTSDGGAPSGPSDLPLPPENRRIPLSAISSASTSGREIAVALLPTATTIMGIAAAVLFGPSIWDVSSGRLPAVAVRLGHLFWFCLGLGGTLWMWNDADEIAASRHAWTPRPLTYIVAGALVFALGGGGFYFIHGYPLSQLGLAVLGLTLLGLPMSSTITGPVYLFIRFRNLGGESPVEGV